MEFTFQMNYFDNSSNQKIQHLYQKQYLVLRRVYRCFIQAVKPKKIPTW